MEHPANSPDTWLHGQSSHSPVSDGQGEQGWVVPFGFGPCTTSQICDMKMRVYLELKRRRAACPPLQSQQRRNIMRKVPFLLTFCIFLEHRAGTKGMGPHMFKQPRAWSFLETKPDLAKKPSSSALPWEHLDLSPAKCSTGWEQSGADHEGQLHAQRG